jgi:serine/threonine-protein kinase
MIGQTIGNYLVRQKLGEGGMGSVYLAEHPHIGKKVALKILHAEFASNQEVVTRFFNEAKAVNDINHPNIVDIIDYGVLATGNQGEAMVYFIMEFLPGITLTQLIQREAPLPPERALAIAMQVADALSASHKANIVHRDLKPDNIILISKGRERDFVKLLDFGIAKLTGDQPGSRRTRTGIVMGTPAYMSPEQCEGRGTVDHRTDIYALGIVLYEAITGRVPFVGDGYGEVLVQHLTQMPAAPSTIRGVIPPHVEQIVMKALQKRPDDRYPTMDDFMRAMADPVGYVEANGGIAGFASARLMPQGGPVPTTSRLTPSPLSPMTPVPGAVTGIGVQTPTTLGGSAGEVAGGAGKKSKTGLYIGLGAAAAAIGVGVALLASGGKKDASAASSGSGSASGSGSGSGSMLSGSASGSSAGSSGSASGMVGGSGSASGMVGSSGSGGSATSGSGSASGSSRGSAGSGSAIAGSGSAGSGSAGSGSAIAGSGSAGSGSASGSGSAEPEQITVTIDGTPAGASVFFAGEKTERCKTPCSFKVAKSKGSQTVTVKAVGFLDEKYPVDLASSDNIDVALKKKVIAGNGGTGGHGGSGSGGHGGSGNGGHGGSGSGGKGHGSGGAGDNTINPFDN